MQISTPITPMHANVNFSCRQKMLVCETLLNKQPFPNYRKKKPRDSIDICVDSGWCTSVLISVVTEDNSQEPVNNITRVLQFHGPHASHNGAENQNLSL